MILLFPVSIFISIFFRCTLSFHLPCKISQYNLSNKQPYKSNINDGNVNSVSSFFKLQNGNSYITRTKLLSFFGHGNEKNFELNEEEKEYLKQIGASEDSNYNDLVKSHEAFIGTVTDIKSKLKYKDLFFFILQKIIHKSLHKFKKQQKYNIFKSSEYTSELSVNYVKNSNIEEKLKEQLIKKLNQEKKSSFFFLNIFKWKTASEVFNISKLMIPFSALGFGLPKMSLFSVAVNLIITAHFLTYKKNQKKKLTLSTLLLTLFPIALHSSIGLISNTLFFKYVQFNLPHYLKKENVLSLFVNSQLYLASLIYFTNNESEEGEEDTISDNASLNMNDQTLKEDRRL